MKTKQLSFEFPYKSNADGVVKLEQFLRQNLLDIEKKYNYDKDYKWELQKLKRDREDQDYRIEVMHKINKEIYVAPHPFDDAMQNIKRLVDQAIDDALGEGVTKKNYDNVKRLAKEEAEVIWKILDTQVYNEETGWMPSDNVWLYHFIRARPAIRQIFDPMRPDEKSEYLKI
tara:strand:- start:156 stop:671 length:516 start_codon:yes stop_codon:yes gene_type:complete